MVASLLVDKIVSLALNPEKANQWAVELIWGYVEGKPVQGSPKREDSRVIEERIDDITTQHLNSLTASFAKPAGQKPSDIDVAVGTDGRATGDMDVPGDGPPGPEGTVGQPEMANAAATQSG